MIGIPGTCTPAATVGIPVSQKKVGTHLWIEWGHKGGRAEQAAGVALALRRNVFTARNVRQVYQPPDELAGRFGAVRLVRGDVDMCAIVVYQYPEPHPPNTEAQRKQARRLWLYLAAFLDRLPHRCLPILLLDANGHRGFHRHEGYLAHINSAAVGQAEAALENFNGGEFRQLLELHHLGAVNTFHECGPTYFGTTGHGTRVDYVCLPQSRLHEVTRCYVQKARAYRLQWHACMGLRDHVPLTVVLSIGCSINLNSMIFAASWTVICLPRMLFRVCVGRSSLHWLKENVSKHCRVWSKLCHHARLLSFRPCTTPCPMQPTSSTQAAHMQSMIAPPTHKQRCCRLRTPRLAHCQGCTSLCSSRFTPVSGQFVASMETVGIFLESSSNLRCAAQV